MCGFSDFSSIPTFGNVTTFQKLGKSLSVIWGLSHVFLRLKSREGTSHIRGASTIVVLVFIPSSASYFAHIFQECVL